MAFINLRAFDVRVLISYLFDWIIVVLLTGGGGVLTHISGYKRPFSLQDVSISYPLKDDIISIPVLVILAMGIPALIILLCTLFASPTLSNAPGSLSSAWRQKIWQVHAGWLGLAFALMGALFVTAGLKDMVGKPRPDLLGRCEPDLDNIQKYVVGGLGKSLQDDSAFLVTSAICKQKDTSLLDDGFAAFPSGHSSFSTAGLLYLSLWLCARYSLSFPLLPAARAPRSTAEFDAALAARDRTAAPPLWQVCAAAAPLVSAFFICASRYADFHHAGIDILAGMAIGAVFGTASFRLYHCPLGRGRSLVSWGHRPAARAFFAGRVTFDDKRREEIEPRLGGGGVEGGSGAGAGGMGAEGYELHDVEVGGSRRQHTGESWEEPMLRP